MAHLIDKDAVLAEIDRQKIGYNTDGKHSVEYDTTRKILDILDHLDVKEADDEPECRIFPRPIECYSTCKECPYLATNNKAQKGE